MTEPTEERPLVTFALFAYNQERFIREAVEGALAQTYSPLQVILSDDCSSDRTFEIIQEMVAEYSGPHEILLNRNPINLGVGAHVNRIMELAKAEWIVGAAGDDISVPERTSKIISTILNFNGRPLSIWSKARFINEDGFLLDKYIESDGNPHTIYEIARNINPVMGCTHAWHRYSFDFFGKLNDKLMMEDNAISFRSYLLGNLVYVSDCLVYYRTHNNNLTNYLNQSSEQDFYRYLVKKIQMSLVAYHQRLMDLCIFEFYFPDKYGLYKLRRLILKERRFKWVEMQLFKKFPKVDWFSIINGLDNPYTYRHLFRIFFYYFFPVYYRKRIARRLS